MYQIFFYVPETHKEKVKEEIFKTGAGKIGHYEACCFEFEGVGEFKPLEGANPFVGNINKVERVREIKVELICRELFLKSALEKLKEFHPYEEPAYGVIKLESF